MIQIDLAWWEILLWVFLGTFAWRAGADAWRGTVWLTEALWLEWKIWRGRRDRLGRPRLRPLEKSGSTGTLDVDVQVSADGKNWRPWTWGR